MSSSSKRKSDIAFLAVLTVGAGALALTPAAAPLLWPSSPEVGSLMGVVLALPAALALGFMGWRLKRDHQEMRHLASVLNADQGARYLLDVGGKIVFANSAARNIFGSSGLPLARLLPMACDESSREEAQRLIRLAELRQQGEGLLHLMTPAGGNELFMVRLEPLESGGTPLLLARFEDMTARTAIDVALRDELDLLADIVDQAPFGLAALDDVGRITFANQRMAEWAGVSAVTLSGQSFDAMVETLPQAGGFGRLTRLKTADGAGVRVETWRIASQDGGAVVALRREGMDAPQINLESMSLAEGGAGSLFANSPVGMALVDLDGRVSACNRALAMMMGLEPGQIAGHALAERLAPEDRMDVAAQLSKLVMGAARGAQIDVRLMGARQAAATMFASPLSSSCEGDGDGPAGLLLHFIDTTEQKNLEVQFAQAQKMHAMGQLAGGIAHDFNNLLTAMIGFCDLLLARHGQGDPSFADIMQIKQNANRAASLVRQLLAFSRRQTLRPRLVDITDSLSELSHLLRRLLGETIELKLDHGRDLGFVRVDPGQFEQVVINLAVNARDAMQGGGALSIRTGTARFERPTQRGAELIPKGEYVLIEVADTGTGIPKEHIGRIFEPFFTTKPVGSGTGLGLSTVYGILKQTDGFVLVDSAPGQGTTFTILLPRYAVGDSPSPPLAESASKAETSGDLSGVGTILLVEDEDAVRMFALRALRNKGYRVLEARSGEQALDLLNSEPVDLLITDIVMPGMDGITLARLVRVEHPAIHLVLMSGYTEDAARGKIDDLKDVHFLAKPFSLKQLAGTVKQVLASQEH
ncbi:MAG: PAS domain-containing protein [Alphaproteobacteria bacterium]|nr:PAS domain-containing protein [Alphaproteobacteria bacterium]